MHKSSSHASRRTQTSIDRSIDRSEEVFVEYPVRVISVAVLVAVVYRRILISFILRCALQKNIFYLSGHIKAQAFSV